MGKVFRPAGGLSLLEILVSLSLLGLFAMLSLPHLVGLKASSLQRETAQLAAKIERAIINAGSSHQLYTLKVNDNVLVAYRNDSIVEKMILKAGTVVSGPTAGIKFYPSGVASPATLLISREAQQCAIKISLRGRVTTSC